MIKNPTEHRLAFKIPEAAESLSISRSYVYELIRMGKIKTIKIGRSRRITKNQLQAYIEEKEAEF